MVSGRPRGRAAEAGLEYDPVICEYNRAEIDFSKALGLLCGLNKRAGLGVERGWHEEGRA